jgi:hypothetical protein
MAMQRISVAKQWLSSSHVVTPDTNVATAMKQKNDISCTVRAESSCSDSGYITINIYLLNFFLIPFYLQAVRVHLANGVNLRKA